MFLFYKITTYLAYPIIIVLIYCRKIIGKEDPERFKEKIFFQKKEITAKKLVWFHGASIGEINSIIPIIKYFLKKNDELKIIITSVTLSSSKIFENEFKKEKNIIHKYFPVDVPHLINNFIKEHEPNLVIFVDSEIWPNCISEIKRKKIPIVLLNARITNKTLGRWLWFKNFAKKMFSSFDICIASSVNSKENLEILGANNISYYGNLKYINSSKKLEKLEKLTTDSLKNRIVWIASSTHKGEEDFCFKTHKLLKNKYPNILTIIAPRHIDRVKAIMAEVKDSGLKAKIIDDDMSIRDDIDILLINSFGSLNKYYECCKNIFIGKSLNKELILEGGQNPIEAARLGCKIYHGPYIYNFMEVYEFLKKNNISEEIKSPEELSSKIIYDIDNQLKIDDSKLKKIDVFGKNIFNNTVKKLEELI